MASWDPLGGPPIASHIAKALGKIYTLLTSFSWLLKFSTSSTPRGSQFQFPTDRLNLTDTLGKFQEPV